MRSRGLVYFLELRRQCGVSHEVREGAQGASRVAPGKSGPHEMARGSSSLLSSHGRVIGPQPNDTDLLSFLAYEE